METVEEYLKRGGRIKREPIRKVTLKRLPQGEALRRCIKREKRNVGLE